MKKNVKLLCLFFCFSIHWYAFSLMPFADTGRLLRGGRDAYVIYSHLAYTRSGISTSAFNWDIIGRWDQGMFRRRDLNKRYFLAVGQSGLQVGAFIKWVPLSDKGYQPAAGVIVGSGYRLERFWQFRSIINLGSHFVELYLQPFVSKEFNTFVGPIIPYMAMPVITQTRFAGLQTHLIIQAVWDYVENYFLFIFISLS